MQQPQNKQTTSQNKMTVQQIQSCIWNATQLFTDAMVAELVLPPGIRDDNDTDALGKLWCTVDNALLRISYPTPVSDQDQALRMAASLMYDAVIFEIRHRDIIALHVIAEKLSRGTADEQQTASLLRRVRQLCQRKYLMDEQRSTL